MSVNLSIKNAPDAVVRRLKRRAKRNRRSLQGEMLTILAEAAGKPPVLSPHAVLSRIRRLGIRTPSEAVAIVRADRRRGR